MSNCQNWYMYYYKVLVIVYFGDSKLQLSGKSKTRYIFGETASIVQHVGGGEFLPLNINFCLSYSIPARGAVRIPAMRV